MDDALKSFATAISTTRIELFERFFVADFDADVFYFARSAGASASKTSSRFTS
jgi:hypothetical protein